MSQSQYRAPYPTSGQRPAQPQASSPGYPPDPTGPDQYQGYPSPRSRPAYAPQQQLPPQQNPAYPPPRQAPHQAYADQPPLMNARYQDNKGRFVPAAYPHRSPPSSPARHAQQQQQHHGYPQQHNPPRHQPHRQAPVHPGRSDAYPQGPPGPQSMPQGAPQGAPSRGYPQGPPQQAPYGSQPPRGYPPAGRKPSGGPPGGQPGGRPYEGHSDPYGSGQYGGSQPDLSAAVQKMSIHDPRAGPPQQAPQMPPYASSRNNSTPSLGRPASPAFAARTRAPQSPQAPRPPQHQYVEPAYAAPYPETYAEPHGYAPVESYDELPSPTAVSAPMNFSGPQPSVSERGGASLPKISTNKIPPSSTVANNPISPLAAEYRKEITASPIQLYDESTGFSQDQEYSNPYLERARNATSGPPSPGSDVVNMYLEDEPSASKQRYDAPQQSPTTSQFRSESKPVPMRQYSRDTPDPLQEIPDNKLQKDLTTSSFEASRRNARKLGHDPKVQLELAKTLVEACGVLSSRYSDPNTPLSSGSVDAKTERKNRENWTGQAYKIVKKLAGNSYPPAIFYLASNYSSGGLGLEVDYDKAYELYSKAARLDHGEAAYRVAVCNEIGAGTRGDVDKAMFWYKKAAQIGDVSAMYKLGMISLNGLLGQPRSLMEAVTWLQRAADRADSTTPHAVHELGLLYERADTLDVASTANLGTTKLQKDEKKALDLFIKAAKLGYPPSQFRLGCAYEYGTLGCQIDPKRSIAWYSRAAEKEEPESELALSGWYLTGSDGILQQSDTEAYLWARKAAEKGLAKAEYALGYYSEVGIGAKSDIEEAKRWYYKAAAQKHPKAISRLQELRQDR